MNSPEQPPSKIPRYAAMLLLALVPGCHCKGPDLSPDPEKELWSTFGLEGKQVRALASENTFFGNNTIYAGTPGGGVYRVGISTKDPWENLSITNANCTCGAASITVQAIGPGSVAGGAVLFVGATGPGIFRLTSGPPNVSWEEFSGPTNVKSFAFDNANKAWAASQQGVWETDNGGLSWTLNNQITYVGTLAWDEVNGVLYAVALGGVYRSIDQGATWTSVPTSNIPPATATFLNSLTLFMNSGGSPTLFVTHGNELYRRPPNSQTWASYCCGGLFVVAVGQFTPVATSGFGGTPHLFVGTSGQGVYSLEPNGAWENKQGGMFNLNVLSLVADNQGWVVAGTTGGAFRAKYY